MTDVTAIDIIRPLESDGDLVVPAIIDPSPYYTTLGRGNEGEYLDDLDTDGRPHVFPLFYDNYFVPRGYAVIYAQMNGTGYSDGCPMHGGEGDIASMKAVVDWLNGRTPGHDSNDVAVTADWHNGHSAMIGKSYDGTLANGVAATGVDGLSTIVPIDAISDWYKYSRTGGVRHNTDYASYLSGLVTNNDREDLCEPTRDTMDLIDGDEDGDVNDFWAERNYLPNIDQIEASVFLVQALNDDNVRMDHAGPYWQALTELDVPRRIWLAKVGHVDPFDFDRAKWVDTLHRWFDYWLQGLDNGIMAEPMARVETDPGVFEEYANWPVPGTENVDVYLTGTAADANGDLLIQAGTGVDALSFVGPGGNRSENNWISDPDEFQGDERLMFLSEPLTADLRMSGTPVIQLEASIGRTQSNLSGFLVDYGPNTRTPRSGNGVTTTDVRTCWGEEGAAGSGVVESACYLEVERRSVDDDLWRVSRGILDSSNRDSLIHGEATDVVAGQEYDFTISLQPYDHTFPAGHRVGVVIGTNLSGFASGLGSVTVTVDAKASKIVLPIVGGLDAAAESAGFGTPAPVIVSFDLGGHGVAMPDQEVAYGTAAAEPDAPSETGWVFQGWYADADHATPFDFTAELTANTTVYAKWAEIADVVATLELSASSTSVDVGDSITLAVTGFDGAGESLGDVTNLVTFESSLDTDRFVGNTVTFVHASTHVITATLGEASGSVSVWVEPAASVVTPSGDLATTGASTLLPLGLLALALALVGLAIVVARRRA